MVLVVKDILSWYGVGVTLFVGASLDEVFPLRELRVVGFIMGKPRDSYRKVTESLPLRVVRLVRGFF